MKDKEIIINKLMKKHKNLGISIALIKDYKIKEIISNNLSKKTLVFQGASIGKILTSVCVMKLIEKGVLEFDKDVNDYLKNWKVKDKKCKQIKVTIKQLLSHTAGINCSGFKGYNQNKKIPSLIQILEGKKPSNNDFIYCKYKRNKYRYSGGGYEIIQKIIEDITNKSFEKVVKKYLFKPIKLKNSSFSKPKKFVQGYESNKQVNKGYFIYPEKAAAGLWTTSEDLAKLLIEIQLSYIGKSNKILSTKSVRTILKPIISAEGNFRSLGFFVSKDKKKFYHTGHNVGYRTKFVVDFKGNGIVILTNNGKGNVFINKLIKHFD